MRMSTWVFIVFAITLGAVLFHIKYRVSALETEWLETQRAIQNENEAVKILHAEWSYLGEPERLQALSEKFLSLKPMSPQQQQTLSEVMRIVEEEAFTQEQESVHGVVQ